jgi:uncharacterized protein YjiK
MKKSPPVLLAFLALLGAACPAGAAITLSSYTLAGTYALPTPESTGTSGIAYDRSSNSLFVMSDNASYIVQVNLTGQLQGAMALSGFSDTEAIAYYGPGQFLVSEERIQTVDRVTYQNEGVAFQSASPQIVLGGFAGNSGVEGVTFDPRNGDLWAVKEKEDQAIYHVANYAGGGTSVVVNPFTPTGLGVGDLSDIYSMANSLAIASTPEADNFLIISQQSNKLIEVNRSGGVVGTLDLTFLGKDNLEGVTMDDAGNIYITSEAPTLYVFKAVPEASSMLLGLVAFPLMLRRRR